jgi:hypothetical protein
VYKRQELVYGTAKISLNKTLFGGHSSGVQVMTVRSNSTMFHKENLWQIASQKISQQYTKLVFIDGDVILDDPTSWIVRCSEVLNSVHIAQAFSSIKFQEAPNSSLYTLQPLLCAASSVRTQPFDSSMSYPSPGYGLAVKRSWLTAVGGLITYAVAGAGDLFMLGGLCSPDHMMNSEAYVKSPFAHKDVQRFLSRAEKLKTKVGFVPHTALHLYHGKRSDRQYKSRHDLFQQLMENDLHLNRCGVLEFISPHWNTPMLEYFQQRKEDE